MRGHRHDRAGAVVGQHVVGSEDRDVFAVDRVDGHPPQRHSGLGPALGQPLDVGGTTHLVHVLVERVALLVGHQFGGQR